MDIERWAILGGELTVAMECGCGIAFMKFRQDLHKCIFLCRRSRVFSGEFAICSATTNVAYSDGVLVVPRAMDARDGLVQAFMDGAVEIYQVMITDV